MNMPVGAWWGITAMSVVVYLAVLIPWLPTRATRVRAALMPLLLGFAALASHQVRGYSTATLLGTVTGLLLGVPLGLVGQQRKMARYVLDQEADPENHANRPSPAATLRAVLTLVVMASLGMWLGSGARI
ncbi:hypothetical protein ACFV23_19255 [Streptomyces sp. NPDC059627]